MLEMLRINHHQGPTQIPKNENTIPSFNVMPDLSKSIDLYNGEQGPRSASIWLRQIQTTATLHQWPDVITFQTARTHLDGAAKHWFASRGITDWHSFKEAFHKSFIFETSKTELWKKMCERIQHSKESESLYFHEKVSMCMELGSFNCILRK